MSHVHSHDSAPADHVAGVSPHNQTDVVSAAIAAQAPFCCTGTVQTSALNAAAEECFTSGPHQPYPVLLTHNPCCCVGTDQPGVGFTHAGDCPILPGRVTPEVSTSFRPNVLGEVGPSLRRLVDGRAAEELQWLEWDSLDAVDALTEIRASVQTLSVRYAYREGLIAQLLFAARDLAEAGILGRDREPIAEEPAPAIWCRECQMTELGGKLTHTGTCKTGRVLGLIARLLNGPENNLEKKVAAPVGEQDGEGAGMRLRCADVEVGFFGEPWRVRVDRVLETVTICDCDGNEVAQVFGADAVVASDRGFRIADCVNSADASGWMGEGGPLGLEMLSPDFLKAMNEIGEYGFKKYGERSFQARSLKGDRERDGRTTAEAMAEHARLHFNDYLKHVPHDHFGDELHQLAAVAFNAMMEAHFAGLVKGGGR